MAADPNADGARHCSSCQMSVYPCRTYRQLQSHVAQGHCVAINLHEVRPTLGIIDPDSMMAEER